MKAYHTIVACLLGLSNAPVMAVTVNGCTIGPAALCVEHDLRVANLRGANLARADLSGSDLSGADLGGANLQSADLDQAKLNRANLGGARAASADLSRAEMYGVNLRDADLRGVNLHSADLNGATLTRAKLAGANLAGAHLPGADLRQAQLQRANLSGALLSHADFRGADLSGANLSQATLIGADLTRARLTGAVFDGASTRGCIGCPSAAVQRETLTKRPPVTPPASGNASGCWARAYKGKNFSGDSLSLVGPAEVANVADDWGFAWDPQFESLRVGPNAVLSVFDDPYFHDRTATFQPDKQLPDLDAEMGIFRTMRSMRLTCQR